MSIEHLYQLYKDNPLICTDSRNISENCLFFALKGDHFDGNLYVTDALKKGAKYAIIDNEAMQISPQCILVEDVLSTLQQLAQYHRLQLQIPVIGITGTNGKTTTKELIREALSAKYEVYATEGNLNNHIGVPLSLLRIQEKHQIAIIEMGANHEGEIALLCSLAQPTHGLITNVGKAHLEGFGSFEGVVRAKSELYYYLLKNDKTVFVNQQDPHLMRMASRFKEIITYGGNTINNIAISLTELSPFIHFSVENTNYTSHLLGEYNFTNIQATLCVATHFEVSWHAAAKKIAEYVPSNNRSQIVQKGTNQIILDAYNANPTSMKAAIESFHKITSNKKLILLGDMFELGASSKEEHQNIVNLCHDLGFTDVILCGKHFSETETTFAVYENSEVLKNAFNLLNYPHYTLLVKGSRGMKLESLFM